MSEFKVDLQKLNTVLNDQERMLPVLEQSTQEIRSIKSSLRMELRQRERIDSRLNSAALSTETHRGALRRWVDVGRQAYELYRLNEEDLVNLRAGSSASGQAAAGENAWLYEEIQFAGQTMTKLELIQWLIANNKTRAHHGLYPGDPLYDLICQGDPGLAELLAIALPNMSEVISKKVIASASGGDYLTKELEENIARVLESYLEQPMKYQEGDFTDVAKLVSELGLEGAKNNLIADMGAEAFENSLWADFFEGMDVADAAIDWGIFSVEQIDKFMTDYTNNINVLETLKGVMGEDAAAAAAIDNLMDRYRHTAYSVVEDTGQKLVEGSLDAVATAAGVPLKPVLDLVFKVTGVDAYGDNMADLMSLQIQHNDVYQGYVELMERCISPDGGATAQDYLDLETSFNYLKNSRIQQYEILQDMAKDPDTAAKIAAEIDKLKNYKFGGTW